MQQITPTEHVSTIMEGTISVRRCQRIGRIILCVLVKWNGSQCSRKKVAVELEPEMPVKVYP